MKLGFVERKIVGNNEGNINLLTQISFSFTAPFVMIYLKRYIKVSILFTVTFFSDSYVLVVFQTTLLGCLNFTIGVRCFNIKNIFGIHEFDSISQMSLTHHLWICYLILDAIWWYAFDTSGGMHLILLVLIWTTISLISFIDHEGEYFWNDLQRLLFPLQTKDPFCTLLSVFSK